MLTAVWAAFCLGVILGLSLLLSLLHSELPPSLVSRLLTLGFLSVDLSLFLS